MTDLDPGVVLARPCPELPARTFWPRQRAARPQRDPAMVPQSVDADEREVEAQVLALEDALQGGTDGLGDDLDQLLDGLMADALLEAGAEVALEEAEERVTAGDEKDEESDYASSSNSGTSSSASSNASTTDVAQGSRPGSSADPLPSAAAPLFHPAEEAAPVARTDATHHVSFQNLNGSSIAYYANSGRFYAYCKEPGHGKCLVSRVRNKRPLGFLFAWLLSASDSDKDSRDSHSNHKPDKADRALARLALHARQDCHGLLSCERPLKAGEDPELDRI